MSAEVPPDNALDAEEAVLAAVLIEPALLHTIGWLKPEHFYSRSYGHVYEATLALALDNGVPPDVVTLANWLRTQNRLNAIEAHHSRGVAALAAIIDSCPSVGNLESYARIVFEAWQIRQLERVATEVLRSCRGVTGNRRALLDQAEAKIAKVTSGGVQRDTGAHAKDVVRARFQDLQARCEAQAAGIHVASGLATGFSRIDDMTGGISKPDLWIIGARPGHGKTSLALGIGMNASYGVPGANEGDPPLVPMGGVAFFSLEMSKEQIIDRALCAEARIDTQALKQARIYPNNWPDLTRAAQFLSSIPLWIDDAKGLTTADIKGRALRQRAAWEREGIPLVLVVVDYLQLIKGPTVRGEMKRDLEVAQISKDLKAMTAALGCPVLALAQLNRSSEKEQRRPRPSDIAESDQIVRDADFVGFLCRDKETPEGAVDLWVAKQRNGAVAAVPLAWAPQFTRFDNYEGGSAPPGL
jgi:replicative DNA helicase